MKFFKEHPYLIMGYIVLISLSVGIGLRDGAADGCIFFGLVGAAATGFAYLANET